MKAYRWIALGLLMQAGVANAATVTITVVDSKGEKVDNAVVTVTDPTNPSAGKVNDGTVTQIDKEFVPFVIAVEKGAKVSFPNKDSIRHHVYSFSEAKQFEIPLYSGTPGEPVAFDKPGVVALGCNIHDWMSSYIYVSPTPYFGVTDQRGVVTINQVPAGEFQVEVWHPELKGDVANTRHNLGVSMGDSATLTIEISKKRLWKSWRSPTASGGGYR
jgi:plastocyanin